MLEFRRTARKHDVAARLSASRELEQETALADSGLPDDLDRNRPPVLELLERLIELPELRGTADELPGIRSHRRLDHGRWTTPLVLSTASSW